MEELRCVDNKKWIWIIAGVLLLSGSFGGGDACSTGIGGMGSGGNFLDNLKCGNNSWIWILALIFLFNNNC